MLSIVLPLRTVLVRDSPSSASVLLPGFLFHVYNPNPRAPRLLFSPPPKVDKLRKDNDNLKKGNESLRRERQYEKQKALSTYEASGMSYHALNQTVKALSLSKQKLTAEVRRGAETGLFSRVFSFALVLSCYSLGRLVLPS